MISGKNGMVSKNKSGSTKGKTPTLKGDAMYTKVSQSVIDKIKKDGMVKSLKKAATSGDAAFVQGVRRMYGAERLKAAKVAAKTSAKPARAVMTRPSASVLSTKTAAPKASRYKPGSIADNISKNKGIFGNKKGK